MSTTRQEFEQAINDTADFMHEAHRWGQRDEADDEGKTPMDRLLDRLEQAAERQAAWLRLVAWAACRGYLLVSLDCRAAKVWSTDPGWKIIPVTLDKHGIPEHSPTLEAALTAAMDSTRSEA